MTPPADPVGGSTAKSDAAPADLAAEMRGRAVSLHSYSTIHEASQCRASLYTLTVSPRHCQCPPFLSTSALILAVLLVESEEPCGGSIDDQQHERSSDVARCLEVQSTASGGTRLGIGTFWPAGRTR